MKIAIKIFMIIGSVVMAAAIIPLIWCIPMYMHYSKCAETGKHPSLAFKICTLLFVNVVAGILMLVDDAC